MTDRCPIGCMFYEEDDCCIGCGVCLASNTDDAKEADRKLKAYLDMEPKEREEFMKNGAYFNEEE
ncbi:hypothetical protein ACFLTT_00475 [Chloroflexota bacterium]